MENKEIADVMSAIEAKFGNLNYSVSQKDDFNVYTAKINREFWDEVKVCCNKNNLQLKDFIHTSFVLYYMLLNEQLPENLKTVYTAPKVKNTDQKFDEIETQMEEIRKQNEEMSRDLKNLSTQFQTVISLFSGRLTNGN